MQSQHSADDITCDNDQMCMHARELKAKKVQAQEVDTSTAAETKSE